ncbi:hypothetical protein [Agromyces sp. Soil535]|uniref:hypothetical protein n=1 Tax=Agromyces sp. Soil535 TaxID=1736390 RepID=UPI0006F764F1|nr:hypothetical protein [Agromyces sp. Soil535]KRE23114.1 hypothetical protein ASG80_09725 [Agromyces sp. Soil535]
MIELGAGTATSTARPSAYFARWLDHATWSEWSPDTEWVRIEEPVIVGSRGSMKPKGGPTVRFQVKALRPDAEYTDTTSFPGARLDFQHTAAEVDGVTHLEVNVTMTGVLASVWAKVVGGRFATSVQQDLDRLVALVEARP